MTIKEYRKIMKDYISTEEQINKRIAYIEALCKNIIDSEIEKYLNQNKDHSFKE